MEGTNFEDLKSELLNNTDLRSRYDSPKPKYAIISALIARRNELAISQRQLARKIGMKQPAICRIESGNSNVTLGTLFKVAEAMGMEINIHVKK